MALLQGLLTFLSRKAGKILNTRVKRERRGAAAAVAALALSRLSLSMALKLALNKILARSGPFRGRVEAVGLGFLRGRAVVKCLSVSGASGPARVRFSARKAEVNLRWRSLLRGVVEVEAEIDAPVLHVSLPLKPEKEAKPAPPAMEAAAPPATWQKTVRDLFPFRLSRLRIKNGCVNVTLTDGRGFPLWAEGIQVELKNLSNRDDGPASVEAALGLMGNGGLYVSATARPFAAEPACAVTSELDGLDLPQFNPLLGRLAGVELDSGNLKFVFEAALQRGRVEGCLTPVIDNLNAAESDGKRRVSRLKGGLIDLLAALLESRGGKRIGTKIRFSGPLDDVKVDKVAAVRALFRNAFIERIRPAPAVKEVVFTSQNR